MSSQGSPEVAHEAALITWKPIQKRHDELIKEIPKAEAATKQTKIDLDEVMARHENGKAPLSSVSEAETKHRVAEFHEKKVKDELAQVKERRTVARRDLDSAIKALVEHQYLQLAARLTTALGGEAAKISAEARLFFEKNTGILRGRDDASLWAPLIFAPGGIVDSNLAEIARRIEQGSAPAKKVRKLIPGQRTVRFLASTFSSNMAVDSKLGAFSRGERASFSMQLCEELIAKNLAEYCDSDEPAAAVRPTSVRPERPASAPVDGMLLIRIMKSLSGSIYQKVGGYGAGDRCSFPTATAQALIAGRYAEEIVAPERKEEAVQ